jgi:FxsC-like protein
VEKAAGPLFFTSYATTAEDRGQVQRFHTDVQNEVHGRLGRHPGHEGVLKDPFPAQGPDPAVLGSRTLLALYSEAYLRGDDSARDWSVFRERVDRARRRTGQAPQALIGVVWRAEGLVLPLSVTRAGPVLNGWDRDGGTAGVADLLEDPGGLDAYRELVRQVADRLVAYADRQVPALSGEEAAAVPPRFGRSHAGRAPAAADVPDSRRVTLLCLTASRDRMRGLRGSLDGYGETPEDWRPFPHQTSESATGIVVRALSAYGVDDVTVRPLPAPAAPDAPDARSTPEQGSWSAVLLVDPWLASATSPEALREELAGWASLIGAVVVVMARGDEETSERTIELRRAVLHRVTHSGLQAPHHEAGSPQGLAHAVIGAVADMLATGSGASAEPLPSSPQHPRHEGVVEQGTQRTPETRAERLSRRRHERSTWLSPVAGLLPPLLLGTPGGNQAET